LVEGTTTSGIEEEIAGAIVEPASDVAITSTDVVEVVCSTIEVE